jgi:N-glycosylase/DNA lyase
VVEVAPDELDLRLCVSSGQVFRWDETAPDQWLGVDGDGWFHVDATTGALKVETNRDEGAFRSLFRLDESLAHHLDRIRSADPELEPYIVQLPGLRVMRPSCVVEETFCFLCTPNNNLARILKMTKALASYGEKFPDADTHRFPTVERIANIDEDDLRAKGFGYRAATIPSIARQVVERGGKQWLESLKSKQYQEAHEALTQIKGIGPKLADCICLFALHHTEAVPVDTHLWQAAKRHYFADWEGGSLTAQRYRKIGDHFRDRFGDLAGWAHQYLFYDNLKNWRTYRKG